MESKMKDPISKWANEAQKRNKEDFADMREAELARKDMLDEALDAMNELHILKELIEERLSLHRRHIADFVDNVYDETVMARFDELTKLKYYLNTKLNK